MADKKLLPGQTRAQQEATEKAEKSLLATRKRVEEHLLRLAGK